MNDRYLYRAKHIHVLPCNEHLDGTWVIGYLSGEHYISNEDGDHLIDPETICQCTGLKDKNGKLIWENNIVKPFYDLKGIVRFGERDYSREFGFYIEWMSKSCYRKDFLYWAEKCEVIGSAIDNPELLAN